MTPLASFQRLDQGSQPTSQVSTSSMFKTAQSLYMGHGIATEHAIIETEWCDETFFV